MAVHKVHGYEFMMLEEDLKIQQQMEIGGRDRSNLVVENNEW